VKDEEDLKELDNESVRQKIEDNMEEIEVRTGCWESMGIVEIIVDSKLFDYVSLRDFPLPEYLSIRYTSAQKNTLHIRDNETLKKYHSINRLRFVDDFSFVRTTQRYLRD
jgi:hypothetical protein